ncbi:MAG: flavodoxin-dependent (E)-4-hydroxy-3-methylbut-2-enyl-diphosphate synthase [Acholeplasmataceae bacterium]|jgi:(E)-4-hydroxy-3-methylbut-2-enyl-diphosphate synthase|nr:flavodoxin-dependent (E)-4-hydroxy-3-methylbut-2-enyl-diphosphate synthase [Acholeplasmataceae bacterium]
MTRTRTRSVKVGNLVLGGNNKVYIQSMTNTKTFEVAKTVEQINLLTKAGCEIVRVAVLNKRDALALGEIKKQITIPLVADIHFNYKLALEAINQGVEKIRLNPGNINDREKVKLVVNACQEKNIPIRIGVNSGSMMDNLEPTPENMVKTAKYHIDILEELNFYDIVLSLKATNMETMINAYRLASKSFNYPLHVGVTEAGTLFSGSIKSAMGIGIVLNEGLGSTIRVSLTDKPELEIRAAKEILKNLNLIENVPNLISCPTCGRLEYNMIPIAKQIEQYLTTIKKNITVAVMGCRVNGPGEAKHADIGIAGGKGVAVIFKKGEIVTKVKEDEVYDTLIKMIDEFEA